MINKLLEKLLNSFGTLSITTTFFLTSLCFLGTNFLPNKYLERLHLKTFLNNYDSVFVIIFFVSFFLLILSGLYHLKEKHNQKIILKFKKEQQDRLFNDLEALKILYILQYYNPNPAWINYTNQRILQLKQFDLIIQATNCIPMENINDTRIPYILQPIAEEKLKQINMGENPYINFDFYELFIEDGQDFSKDGRIEMDVLRSFRSNEYTNGQLLNQVYIDQNSLSGIIMHFPVIFGNERIKGSTNQKYYYGEIYNFFYVDNRISINYKIKGSIPVEELEKHRDELFIGEWELNRTHWALKHANVIKTLGLNFENN